jgi:hypothetical protein
VPIGLQDSSWGGVAIQVFMSTDALKECGDASMPPPALQAQVDAGRAPGATAVDQALAVVAAAELAAAARSVHTTTATATMPAGGRQQQRGSPVLPVGDYPSAGACLYNSMLHPLQLLPVTGLLWCVVVCSVYNAVIES